MYVYRYYMVKQSPELLALIVVALTAGAIPPTDSHLRRADGLGRFSGTMFSNALTRHGGHDLLSLHLVPFCLFDSTTAFGFAAIMAIA